MKISKEPKRLSFSPLTLDVPVSDILKVKPEPKKPQKKAKANNKTQRNKHDSNSRTQL